MYIKLLHDFCHDSSLIYLLSQFSFAHARFSNLNQVIQTHYLIKCIYTVGNVLETKILISCQFMLKLTAHYDFHQLFQFWYGLCMFDTMSIQ